MTKILTTALLLSAGTALSQAAVTLLDTESYDATMTLTFSNITTESTKTMTGSTAIATNIDGITASLTYSSTSTRHYFADQTASQATWAPSINVGNGSDNGGGPWTVCITITNSSSTAYEFSALQLGMNGLQSTGAYQTTSGSTSSYSGTIISNSGVTAKKLVDVTVGYVAGTVESGQESSASTTELVGTIAYNMAGTGSGTPSTGTFSFDTVSIAANSSITLFITADQNSESKIGTYAGITTLSLGVVAIPEPSSFGLLAGLGALALVVSRRRRRG